MTGTTPGPLRDDATDASPIKIRPAHWTDATSIADFNCQMAQETEAKRLDPATVLAGVRALIENSSRGFYLVAEVRGQVIGCLLVTYEWSDWRNGDIWWIQSVYVLPAGRRCGVFRALYAEVRRRAEENRQACALRLYVERENQAAQQTYQAMGMQETRYRIFEFEWPDGPPHEPS